MATGNITLPDELLPRLEAVARAENKTADDIATEAVEKLLQERAKDWEMGKWRDFVADNKHRAEAMGIREEDIPEIIHEYRREQNRRGR